MAKPRTERRDEEYACLTCLDGTVVNDTCDDCGERHCRACDPCDNDADGKEQ